MCDRFEDEGAMVGHDASTSGWQARTLIVILAQPRRLLGITIHHASQLNPANHQYTQIQHVEQQQQRR